MIGLLRGKLIDKRPHQVLLDVGGVGYQVNVPLSTFAGLGALHGETTLLIHTHVREDQLALYGFVTAREKQCFELLISASGVGPALALRILSGMSIEQLVPAIRKGDLAQLVQIPGVGKKTAERIVVELRDKLAVVDVPETGKPATRSQLEADVASALVNLGYDARSVERAIEKARSAGSGDFETLLRGSLQILGASARSEEHTAELPTPGIISYPVIR
jgi:holliday junction DNA helicase RuvA